MKIYRLLGLPLLVVAMLLSACGGTPAAEAPTAAPAAPTAAPAPTTAPTTAAAPTANVPTPTFESVSDQEPTVGAVAASGTLGWRDQILRNDAVIISINDLTALEAGMGTLWDDCLAKVASGLTSIEELGRVLVQ